MIVISNPTAIANEIPIIHSLFEEGLELLHVRKPEYSAEEMKKFVTAIGLEFRNKLVLHSHHQLAEELGINRIHFTEKMRTETFNSPARLSKPCRFLKSTSTHSIEEFNALETEFDYAFLSPVFESISKPNYASKTNLLTAINNRTNFKTQLIALGGIQASNIETTLKAGFDNVALLGTIWNTKNPIQNFKLCQQIALSF